eukprot:scpid92827/ scgid25590/ MFS-type transporter SLC18B1; Solute carrier family 18 member B1
MGKETDLEGHAAWATGTVPAIDDQRPLLLDSNLPDDPTRPPLQHLDSAKSSKTSRIRSNLILFCIALNSMVVAAAISLMMPFFGGEALRKVPSGNLANHFAIGVIFSIATFAEFLAAPILAKDLVNVGSKLMLVLSTFEVSAMVFLFSFVNKIESWGIFLAVCISIRLVQGISTAAYFVSSFSILVGAFPESKGLVNGVLRCANGVGYAMGPAIGGVLYDVAGFAVPFYVFSAIVAVACVLVVIVLPSTEAGLSSVRLKSNISFTQVLSVPWVWMILVSTFLANIIMGYVEPVFSVYLRTSFNLSTTYAGIGFFIFSIFYSGVSLVMGYWIDSWLNPRMLQALGLLSCGIGCQLVGPAPFLPLPKSLVLSYVAFVLFGIGSGLSLVSASPDIANTLHANGLGTPGELRAITGGLYQASMSLGYCAGPLLGSPITAAVGFQYSLSFLGIMYFLWTVVFAIAAFSSEKLLMLQLENLVKGI